MKLLFKVAVVVVCSATIAGCSTWSSSSVEPASGTKEVKQLSKVTSAEQILLTEADTIDRKYTVIGDISATVRKTTVFNKNPTKEQVDAKLKEKAAEVGADAVIMVRYGDKGASLVSWSSLNGRGRAIAFTD